jgi:hypothetical protein
LLIFTMLRNFGYGDSRSKEFAIFLPVRASNKNHLAKVIFLEKCWKSGLSDQYLMAVEPT